MWMDVARQRAESYNYVRLTPGYSSTEASIKSAQYDKAKEKA
jgi:hypothetical protein